MIKRIALIVIAASFTACAQGTIDAVMGACADGTATYVPSVNCKTVVKSDTLTYVRTYVQAADLYPIGEIKTVVYDHDKYLGSISEAGVLNLEPGITQEHFLKTLMSEMGKSIANASERHEEYLKECMAGWKRSNDALSLFANRGQPTKARAVERKEGK